MAGSSLFALIDDIATALDDVAILTKVAAPWLMKARCPSRPTPSRACSRGRRSLRRFQRSTKPASRKNGHTFGCKHVTA